MPRRGDFGANCGGASDHEREIMSDSRSAKTIPPAARAPSSSARLVVSWLVVGIPLAWGVYATLQKAAQLFR